MKQKVSVVVSLSLPSLFLSQVSPLPGGCCHHNSFQEMFSLRHYDSVPGLLLRQTTGSWNLGLWRKLEILRRTMVGESRKYPDGVRTHVVVM